MTKLSPTQLTALRAMTDARVSHISIGYRGTILHRGSHGAVTFRAATGEALLRAGLLDRHMSKGTGDHFYYTLNDAGRQVAAAAEA